MQSSNGKKRGMAIITTLMILSLLLALISAFLVVNRAGNKFTVNSLEKRQAQDGALAAFNCALMELEKNRDWGTKAEPISSYPNVGPVLKFTFTWDDTSKTLTGTSDYNPNGASGSVVLKVRNNLSKSKVGEILEGIVPPSSVSVEATVKVGSVTRKLDTLLRPKPLSHESASAGGNLLLDDVAGLLRIESKDPYVNQVRAGKDLDLPGADDVRFLKQGVAASSQNLNVGGTNLASAPSATVTSFGNTSGGTYLPKADKPEVQTFDPSDFDLPDDVSTLEAGTWTFGGRVKTEYVSHHLNYETHDPVTGARGPDGHTDRHQKKESTYDTLTSPSGKIYPAAAARLGSTVLDPPYDPAPSYPDESSASAYGYGATGPTGFLGAFGTPDPSAVPSDVHTLATGVEVNVVTAQLALSPGRRVEVAGNLVFTGTGTRNPELYFGYDISGGGVATETSLDDGIDAAKASPADYMSAIMADGDINVTGGYVGYGSLIAGGDVTLKASSGLSVAPGLGVLVKGRNVIINPATEPEPALPGANVDADYSVFRDAVNADCGGDWTSYNQWLDHTADTRDGMLNSLGTRSSGLTASAAWASFDAQIGDGGAMPALPGWPGGNITIDQYVRLKTFYQTKSYGYDDGNGDPTWLQLTTRQDDAKGRVENVLNGIAQWAKSYKKTMQAFLASPDPGLPDMFTEGLIFAEQNVVINANNKSVKLVGSVIANQGDFQVNDATKLDLVYDRGLVDALHLGTSKAGKPINLEKVFFTLE